MRLLFWRDTEDELREQRKRVAQKLATKNESEGAKLRNVAERTGDHGVLRLAEVRETDAKKYRGAADERNHDFEEAYFGTEDERRAGA